MLDPESFADPGSPRTARDDPHHGTEVATYLSLAHSALEAHRPASLHMVSSAAALAPTKQATALTLWLALCHSHAATGVGAGQQTGGSYHPPDGHAKQHQTCNTGFG